MLHRFFRMSPATAWKPFSLPVAALYPETAQALRIEFAPADSLSYESGQFLTLLIDIEGTQLRRCYSLCSTPYGKEAPAIIVKRTKGGLVSNFLNDTLRVGQSLRSLPPAGHFTTPYNLKHKRLAILIAAGSGITPLFSIAKSILLQESESELHIFYGNHSKETIILLDALSHLQANYASRLRIQHVLTKPTDSLPCIAGHLAAAFHKTIMEDYTHKQRQAADYFVCCPPPVQTVIGKLLDSFRLADSQIYQESFSVDETGTPSGPLPAEAQVLTIRFAGRDHEVHVNSHESILQAGVQAGIDMPYSCKKGICTTCRGRLLQGKIQYRSPPEGLTQEEIDQRYILCCTAQPLTKDIIVEIE